MTRRCMCGQGFRYIPLTLPTPPEFGYTPPYASNVNNTPLTLYSHQICCYFSCSAPIMYDTAWTGWATELLAEDAKWVPNDWGERDEEWWVILWQLTVLQQQSEGVDWLLTNGKQSVMLQPTSYVSLLPQIS